MDNIICKFYPKELTVDSGTVIIFEPWLKSQNDEAIIEIQSKGESQGTCIEHKVRPATSSIINKEDLKGLLFDRPSTFTFKCAIYPFIRGSINVVEGAGEIEEGDILGSFCQQQQTRRVQQYYQGYSGLDLHYNKQYQELKTSEKVDKDRSIIKEPEQMKAVPKIDEKKNAMDEMGKRNSNYQKMLKDDQKQWYEQMTSRSKLNKIKPNRFQKYGKEDANRDMRHGEERLQQRKLRKMLISSSMLSITPSYRSPFCPGPSPLPMHFLKEKVSELINLSTY